MGAMSNKKIQILIWTVYYREIKDSFIGITTSALSSLFALLGFDQSVCILNWWLRLRSEWCMIVASESYLCSFVKRSNAWSDQVGITEEISPSTHVIQKSCSVYHIGIFVVIVVYDNNSLLKYVTHMSPEMAFNSFG